MRICDWSSDVCYSDLGGLFEQTKIARGRTSAADVELIALKQRGEWPAFLELAVKSRKNILISGATGSGKTTLSKALIQLIPSEERLLTIEDTRELLVPHRNAVHLLYRSEEHTSELQSLMRTSYAVFCLTTKNTPHQLT